MQAKWAMASASLAHRFINTVSYFDKTTPSRSWLRTEPGPGGARQQAVWQYVAQLASRA